MGAIVRIDLEIYNSESYSFWNDGLLLPVYISKPFARFARRENLSDSSLIEAILRAERGVVDAVLGGGLIKQRVARTGQGRRGGYRTLIAFRSGECAIFLFGFAKSERQNIDDEELATLRLVAGQWLADPSKIAKDVAAHILIEVKHGEN